MISLKGELTVKRVSRPLCLSAASTCQSHNIVTPVRGRYCCTRLLDVLQQEILRMIDTLMGHSKGQNIVRTHLSHTIRAFQAVRADNIDCCFSDFDRS